MSMSEWEISKLDQQYGRIEDLRQERLTKHDPATCPDKDCTDPACDCCQGCGEPRDYVCKHGECKGCGKCWQCEEYDRRWEGI